MSAKLNQPIIKNPKLEAIQAAIREQELDGWLFCDHHHRDPIACRILRLDDTVLTTRRWYYLVPAEGEPAKLVHRIEPDRLDHLPGNKTVYSSWRELEAGLRTILAPYTRLGMQYSPRNSIFTISLVDAGTVDLLREMGKTIESSANLVSRFEAVLSPAQRASHAFAQEKIDGILTEAWREIARRVRPADAIGGGKPITEHDMVAWLREALERAGLVYEHNPNFSVNANSANPHYEPKPSDSAAVANGDFVLIDIWGRQHDPGSCFYDVTWTGVIGREPSAREQQIFETVTHARDAAIARIKGAFEAGQPIAGWQADQAARSVIEAAGMGRFFTHRTGHSITSDIHGNGANLDDLESHDDRQILPHTCFSVEPGIYLPQFGVRSEINMLTGEREAHVTGRIQRELVRI